MSEEMENTAAEASTGKPADEKKKKKLSKVFEENILVITEGSTGTVIRCDLDAMPDNVKAWLVKHGFSQKLGDAAAGKEGAEAVEAIQKVYEGLSKGDLTVRAPAGEKITSKSLVQQYNDMEDGPEKVVFKGLLTKLGIKLPEPKAEAAEAAE